MNRIAPYKKYVYLLMMVLVVIAFDSCKWNAEPEVPDGGPCGYKETRIPATVISIDAADSSQFDVMFKLDSNALIPPPDDTISYYMENGRFLSVMEMDSFDVGIGKRFTYLVREIESGACDPFVRQLLMEEPAQ